MSTTNDPELLRLAQIAVDRQDAENRMLEKMCPACRKVYVEAWAERMGKSMARMGEAEYGLRDSQEGKAPV